MKVLMRTTAAGPRGIYEAGKVYEVPRQLAAQWCDENADGVRYAEPAETGAEVTTIEPQENTTRSRGPRRAKSD